MNGILGERLIIAKLEKKCGIKQESEFDHRYKLDFIIDSFSDIHKLTHIGVQVTTNPNDATKQVIFLNERRKKTLVDRSLYVKVLPGVDIDNWGAELIYNAIVAFAFQKNVKQKDVLGVLIKPDISYEFFELAEEEEEERQPTEHTLHGTVIKYFKDKGYGFIEVREKGQWFFHIDQVEDRRLKENYLPNIIISPDTGRIARPIYVDFEDGGRLRPDAVAPNATNVRLSKKNTANRFPGLPGADSGYNNLY